MNDPLKWIPFLGYALAALGVYMHWTPEQVIGLMLACGLAHTGISAFNNTNPPK